MDNSGTEADAQAIEDTSMNNHKQAVEKTASEALKEWTIAQALESKNTGLPKREPDRDTSRVGNQKIRLSPNRHDWNRDRVRWSIRTNNPHTKPKK